VSLQLQESLPHELGGSEVIGRAGLTSVEFRSAQGANVRQHAVGGNQLQGLCEWRWTVQGVSGEALSGSQAEQETG